MIEVMALVRNLELSYKRVQAHLQTKQEEQEQSHLNFIWAHFLVNKPSGKSKAHPFLIFSCSNTTTNGLANLDSFSNTLRCNPKMSYYDISQAPEEAFYLDGKVNKALEPNDVLYE